MKQKRNYYQLLHVQPDAPREIIRSSYRTLMQRLRMHPDLGGDGDSAAALNEAYAVLMEPEHRAEYDRNRGTGARQDELVSLPDLSVYGAAQSERDCLFCAAPCDPGVESLVGEFCGRCQSPLSRPELLQSEEDDRRAILRVSKNQPLAFRTHWPQREPYAGRSEDISLDGMRFQCSVGVQRAQVIKIDCQAFRAVASVARAERLAECWEVGVKFLTLHFQQTRGSFVQYRA